MSGDVVTLADGAGGKASRRLVEGLFLEELRNPLLEPLGDAALVSANGTASPSRPTRTSCGRCAFPAATSASSP